MPKNENRNKTRVDPLFTNPANVKDFETGDESVIAVRKPENLQVNTGGHPEVGPPGPVYNDDPSGPQTGGPGPVYVPDGNSGGNNGGGYVIEIGGVFQPDNPTPSMAEGIVNTMTIVDQIVKTNPDGTHTVDIIVEVNDVVGAENYNIRVSTV